MEKINAALDLVRQARPDWRIRYDGEAIIAEHSNLVTLKTPIVSAAIQKSYTVDTFLQMVDPAGLARTISANLDQADEKRDRALTLIDTGRKRALSEGPIDIMHGAERIGTADDFYVDVDPETRDNMVTLFNMRHPHGGMEAKRVIDWKAWTAVHLEDRNRQLKPLTVCRNEAYRVEYRPCPVTQINVTLSV